MLVLEHKIKAKPQQYKAIDEAIRTVQFIRNKAIRYWMDTPKEVKVDRFALNKYSTELRNEFPFVKALNSMAVQAAAERGWLAISRFYVSEAGRSGAKRGEARIVSPTNLERKVSLAFRRTTAQLSTKRRDGHCIPQNDVSPLPTRKVLANSNYWESGIFINTQLSLSSEYASCDVLTGITVSLPLMLSALIFSHQRVKKLG